MGEHQRTAPEQIKSITVPLATRPGVPNANNVVYDEEEFRRAMDKFQKDIDQRIAFVITHPHVMGEIITIHPLSIMALIEEIREDVGVILPIDSGQAAFIKTMVEGGYAVLGMNYMAHLQDDGDHTSVVPGTMTISSYSIIPKPSTIRRPL